MKPMLTVSPKIDAFKEKIMPPVSAGSYFHLLPASAVRPVHRPPEMNLWQAIKQVRAFNRALAKHTTIRLRML